PASLPPGGRAEIAMSFETAVPLESTGSYGIFHRDANHATWVLADWHPVLAVYDPGIGWNLTPPNQLGDPTYAASAMFDVRIDTPASWAAVASGIRTGSRETAPGRAESRFTAGPAREFTLALDDDWIATSVVRGGVTITAWTEPDVTPLANAQLAADSAANALTAFNRHLEPYPYRELDLVDVPLDGALAVSWSGMIFLDGDAMLTGYAVTNPDSFDAVLAHEVAHLWWGATVGSDSNAHPFMNEGLATVSSVSALRWMHHPGAAAALERWVLDPAGRVLAGNDAVVDLPADAPGDANLRSDATYGKAALGFLAIRAEIGDDAFWSALDTITRERQFGIMTPDDLRRAFETASGKDLGGLWQRWFDSTLLSAAEIAAVAASMDDPDQ
ncbi:MAG: M1 family aminopeptidase, partial [Thermomicrobiales bacterium]